MLMAATSNYAQMWLRWLHRMNGMTRVHLQNHATKECHRHAAHPKVIGQVAARRSLAKLPETRHCNLLSTVTSIGTGPPSVLNDHYETCTL